MLGHPLVPGYTRLTEHLKPPQLPLKTCPSKLLCVADGRMGRENTELACHVPIRKHNLIQDLHTYKDIQYEQNMVE